MKSCKKIKYSVSILLLLLTINTLAISQNDTIKIEIEYKVYNVFGINTKYAEFSPVWHKTNLIFASDREWENLLAGESSWDHIKNINLFKTNVNSYSPDSAVFTNTKIYHRLLVSDVHVGPISFNKDFSEAIFSEVSKKGFKVEGRKVYKPQLYSIRISDNEIYDRKKLDFVKNEYSYSQAAFSPDGSVLYFVSDLPCEKKGTNIFYSKKTIDGWSEPIIVDSINSNGNEMFPTLLGDKLYFSSTEFNSIGGLDLFESKLVDGKWSSPINLGPTINTGFDEFSMIFNPDRKSGYFTSNRDNGFGSDDIYSFNKIKKAIVDVNYKEITGQFEYRRLEGNPSNMEVMLMDEDGNIVMKTMTDELGNFIFKHLPIDSEYTIKIKDENSDVVLILFNSGNDQALLVANKSGEFVYRKLSSGGSNVLSLIDEGDVNLETGMYDFQGQFKYQSLDGGNPKNMKVFLVDEDGNIVMETTTDEFGNFKFEQLSTSNNYIVRVQTEEDVVLMVFNNVDHLMATMANDGDGNFVYRLLESENLSNMQMLSEEETELKFSRERMLVSGVFTDHASNRLNSELIFDVLNKEGDLLMNSKTDSTGYFRIDKLPLLKELIFKINDSSIYYNNEIKLEMLSRSNKTLIILEKDEMGMFLFKRMLASKYNITEIKDLDTTEIITNTNKESIHIENLVLYYPKNEFKLTKNDILILDSILISLINNEETNIQIHSHASSTATDAYNMNLSKKRMNAVVEYFKDNNISNSRISYKAYGESRLINLCGDDAECEEEMHRLNRRTEFKFITK